MYEGISTKKKSNTSKKLGEDSVCDNSISSYGGNSLFSNLNKEFRERYIDNKKNKERYLEQSKISYIIRKLKS